ncbi:MAG: PP2C family protein-serine/threonine phosphatase, partial [Terriglobales bacterium]
SVSTPLDSTRGRRQQRRKYRRDFVWAILMKLSPARRVLLLLALLLLFFGPVYLVIGILILLGLLVLEVADRVGMKRDLEIAREIQLWLLPTAPPAVPGAELAFANLPANTVSGDFYDVFARGDKFFLALADVAGKGVPAAMLMATLHASLRSLAVQQLSLAELVPALNRFACTNSMGGTRFTTAFLAEYDPARGELLYCNAGHNPPLLRRGAEFERLESGGVPLGLLPNATFECATVAVRPEETLLIFSDGLTESFSPQGEEYGEARVRQSLASNAVSLPASVLLERVLADCARFRADARQQDDLTCLLLRRTAAESAST